MTFQALLQGFFVDRLARRRQASAHTIAAYRDPFRLLLACHRASPQDAFSLALEDIDASFVTQYLEQLERERGNCARTRNARLTAIHSFFRYVALTEPAHALLCQRVLAIPSKRFERGPVEFLAPEETRALLAALTRRSGSAAATAPSCWSLSRLACASRTDFNSPSGCGAGSRRLCPHAGQGAKDAVHSASPGRGARA